MIPFSGDDRLRPFVEFSRKNTNCCIYCGKPSNTREHVPSKAFLNRPFPPDLPVLPACEQCNNGYSSDELYTRTYIQCFKDTSSGYMDNLSDSSNDRKEIKEAKHDIIEVITSHKISYNKRIGRILLKLATGHMVYELSEGYGLNCDEDVRYSIRYIFRSSVNEEEWQLLNLPEEVNEGLLPEIGSRIYRNIYVVEKETAPKGNFFNGDSYLVDWSVVQEGTYKYIVFTDGNITTVKIVLMDYLFAEIVIEMS